MGKSLLFPIASENILYLALSPILYQFILLIVSLRAIPLFLLSLTALSQVLHFQPPYYYWNLLLSLRRLTPIFSRQSRIWLKGVHPFRPQHTPPSGQKTETIEEEWKSCGLLRWPFSWNSKDKKGFLERDVSLSLKGYFLLRASLPICCHLIPLKNKGVFNKSK